MRETPGKIACDANGRMVKNPGKKFDGLDS